MTAFRGAHWCAIASLLVALASAGAVEAREKTDVVRLDNGDRITGEIVRLEYGQLTLKTNSFGTVYIEWPDIVSIESEYAFLLERTGGRRSYGVLKSGEGRITVVEDGRAEELRLAEIVRIGQIDDSFWERISGSASVGVSYSKSSSITVSNGSFDATYRARKSTTTLEGTWDRTESPDSGTTDRTRVGLQHSFLRPGPRFIIALASFERNEELGIDGRLQGGGAWAWRFHETQDAAAGVYLGAVANNEWITGEAGSQSSVEGVVGMQWRIFRFAKPEISLSSTFNVYPSLTESGRVRGRTDVTLRRKFAGDFTFDLSFYGDYDNQPPGDRTVTTDYGVSTSLGVTF